MTYEDDMEAAVAKIAEITLPEAQGKSRIHKAPRPEAPEDAATAGERIEAFWEKYPDGSILTEIESREVTVGDTAPYSVYTARVFVRRHADAESPDATAHATRSGADPDEVTAAFPQETAETSAVSRALRNLGILAVPRKPTATAPEPAPAAKQQKVDGDVAGARRATGLTQADLATQMREAGFPWTQAVVSKVERGHRAVTDPEATALATLIGYQPK